MSIALRDQVIDAVVKEFGSSRARVLNSSRGTKKEAWIRAIAIYAYVCRYPGPVNWTETGRMFGRDRTSVRHAAQRVQRRTETNREFVRRLAPLLLKPIAQR